MNKEYEDVYYLDLSSEKTLKESIADLVNDHLKGEISTHDFVTYLDIANSVIQELNETLKCLDAFIKKIRYHSIKMSEYIVMNYVEEVDFVFTLNPTYEQLYQKFIERSQYLTQEWIRYEKEFGMSLNYIKPDDHFMFVFRMANLITDEFESRQSPDPDLQHTYLLAREVPYLLQKARDLALHLNVKLVTDKYFMKKYLGKPTYPSVVYTGQYKPPKGQVVIPGSITPPRPKMDRNDNTRKY